MSEDIKDFTVSTETIKFKINQDIFEAIPDIPAGKLLDFSESQSDLTKVSPEDRTKVFETMFTLILTPESAERFLNRLYDPKNPIGIRVINNLIPWIFEQYGMRPTEALPGSLDGSGNPASGTK